MKSKVSDYLYLVMKCNGNGQYEYVLDSQNRPTIYRNMKQLQKYAYKYRNQKYIKIARYVIDDVIMFEETQNEE